MKIYRIAKSNIEAYHGTPSKFSKFDISFSGQGNDQEGPGIYFTTDPTEALTYTGEEGHVFHVRLNFNKIVPLEGKINQENIQQLLLWSMGLNSESDLENMDMDKFWESSLSNWGEDPYSAFQEALSGILKYSTSPHDAFQQVWIDHYRYTPVDYLKNMVKLGYDGVEVPKDYKGTTHYIVYNPSIIEVLPS